jgi:hypothetical protein
MYVGFLDGSCQEIPRICVLEGVLFILENITSTYNCVEMNSYNCAEMNSLWSLIRISIERGITQGRYMERDELTLVTDKDFIERGITQGKSMEIVNLL